MVKFIIQIQTLGSKCWKLFTWGNGVNHKYIHCHCVKLCKTSETLSRVLFQSRMHEEAERCLKEPCWIRDHSLLLWTGRLSYIKSKAPTALPRGDLTNSY